MGNFSIGEVNFLLYNFDPHFTFLRRSIFYLTSPPVKYDWNGFASRFFGWTVLYSVSVCFWWKSHFKTVLCVERNCLVDTHCRCNVFIFGFSILDARSPTSMCCMRACLGVGCLDILSLLWNYKMPTAHTSLIKLQCSWLLANVV